MRGAQRSFNCLSLPERQVYFAHNWIRSARLITRNHPVRVHASPRTSIQRRDSNPLRQELRALHICRRSAWFNSFMQTEYRPKPLWNSFALSGHLWGRPCTCPRYAANWRTVTKSVHGHSICCLISSCFQTGTFTHTPREEKLRLHEERLRSSVGETACLQERHVARADRCLIYGSWSQLSLTELLFALWDKEKQKRGWITSGPKKRRASARLCFSHE